MEARNDYSLKIKENFFAEYKVTDGQQDYVDRLFSAVTNHLKEIDEKINQYAEKWNTKRMAKVDLAVTRVALGEMFYMKDIPVAVAINEAVDLAKEYGTEDSKRFVNGILGKIARDKDE